MNQIKTGKLIAEQRKAAGLTQLQLAEKLYVTDKAVSKWERGVSFPDKSILSELASILGISVLELLAGETSCDKNDAELIDDLVVNSVNTYANEEKKKARRTQIIILLVSIIIIASMALISFFPNLKASREIQSEYEELCFAFLYDGFVPALNYFIENEDTRTFSNLVEQNLDSLACAISLRDTVLSMDNYSTDYKEMAKVIDKIVLDLKRINAFISYGTNIVDGKVIIKKEIVYCGENVSFKEMVTDVLNQYDDLELKLKSAGIKLVENRERNRVIDQLVDHWRNTI